MLHTHATVIVIWKKIRESIMETNTCNTILATIHRQLVQKRGTTKLTKCSINYWSTIFLLCKPQYLLLFLCKQKMTMKSTIIFRDATTIEKMMSCSPILYHSFRELLNVLKSFLLSYVLLTSKCCTQNIIYNLTLHLKFQLFTKRLGQQEALLQLFWRFKGNNICLLNYWTKTWFH